MKPARHEFDRMLSVADVAGILRKPAKWVRECIKYGTLRAIRLPDPRTGRIKPAASWRVFPSSLAKMLGHEVELEHWLSTAELERSFQIEKATVEMQQRASRPGRRSRNTSVS